MNQVTAATIQQVTDQLSVLGPEPFLIRIGSIEPLVLEHLLRSVSEIRAEFEGPPHARNWRSHLQTRLLHMVISVVDPVLRTLHPPEKVSAKRSQETLSRLRALNAEAKAAAQDREEDDVLP